MAVVKDIVKIMEDIVPSHLAEGWDNCGLQCGNPEWPVNHVVVALDASLPVVRSACETNADLLITHHPLIFSPMKRILLNTPVGEVIDLSVRNKLAIFAAHTNLDSVEGGLNDIFAEKIGLKNLSTLSPNKDNSDYKLVVYVPTGSFQKVLDTIIETGAGKIGDYTACTYSTKGLGTFRPGNSSKPVIGKKNELTNTEEYRIEVRLQKENLNMVINYIKKHHPYETIAYDVYPIMPDSSQTGIGRIGELDSTIEFDRLVAMIKEKLDLEVVKVSGIKNLKVKKIAVCTGSGSGLIKEFFASDADVFVTGDLKYHDAKDAETYHRGLIDVGHFASEEIMVDLIANQLKKNIKQKGLSVTVEGLHIEEDPFKYL